MADKIVAYIGAGGRDGMGCDRMAAQSYPLTTWKGAKIGVAFMGKGWRVNSYFGNRMHQIYAYSRGADGILREYTGRGFGEGMSVYLRETAQSRKARETGIVPRGLFPPGMSHKIAMESATP